jgi:uncharacterized Tic20 family protein
MEQCTACRAEVADYDRRCWNCGAGVKRDSDKLLSSGPTEKELSQARLGHLLALPGMLILGVLFYAALGMFGLLGLMPLNLIIPFVYWLAQRKSRFVRGHAAEALNFQLLWTLAIYAVWFVPLGSEGALYLGFTLVYAVVLMSGIALVLIAAKDAASAGDGKYPIRVPIFR